MPVLYVDVLIALNWLIDYLLLAAVSHLLRHPAKRWRMMTASLFGGFCSCLVLLPPLPTLLLLALEITTALLMILIAFPWVSSMFFIKETLVLFAVSALFSGFCYLIYAVVGGEHFLVNNGCLYADISPLLLTGCAVISYGVVHLFGRVIRHRMPKGGEYRLTVEEEGARYQGRALCDTGLQLSEPFSGKPVIVVEREALLPCLSGDLKIALGMSELTPHPRVRMVPFRSVGGNGLLPAFRPRSVRLCRLGEKERDITGVYVAVTDRLGRGEYQALISNEVADNE